MSHTPHNAKNHNEHKKLYYTHPTPTVHTTWQDMTEFTHKLTQRLASINTLLPTLLNLIHVISTALNTPPHPQDVGTMNRTDFLNPLETPTKLVSKILYIICWFIPVIYWSNWSRIIHRAIIISKRESVVNICLKCFGALHLSGNQVAKTNDDSWKQLFWPGWGSTWISTNFAYQTKAQKDAHSSSENRQSLWLNTTLPKMSFN